MKNSSKIIALLVVAVLLIAAFVVGLSFWAFSQIEQSAEARNHTFISLNSADNLLASLLEAETCQRGYLLTGKEAFLEPYLAGHDHITAKLKELRQLTSNSAALKHLDTLATLIDAKLAQLSQNIELRRNNDMTAVVENIINKNGKQLMDLIRAEMRSFSYR